MQSLWDEIWQKMRGAALWAAAFVSAGFVLAVVLTACSSGSEFNIDGKIEGFGTGNLRLVYYDRGAIQSVSSPAIDGKFVMTGRLSSSSSVLVRIYTNNGALVGRFIAKGGDALKATFSISDPAMMKISGNADSELLARFITDNAEALRSADTTALNSAISDFVTANPKKVASGVLMSDFFVCSDGWQSIMLDLIGKLSKQVREVASLDGIADRLKGWELPTDSLTLTTFELFTAANDTLETFDVRNAPLTLVFFTDTASLSTDSLRTLLYEALKVSPLRVAAINISCDADTALWHQSINNLPDSITAPNTPTDSIDAERQINMAWMPSAYNIVGLENATVNTVPWFVAADSTGHMIYRGNSASQIKQIIDKYTSPQ